MESDLFLKSLDITGFKSFARSTHFEFTTGITALVGPNGSGKSNVVDAIRWCLGEQSVRDLRGQKAEDIIYAGSRQVLGLAEVSLTFAASENECTSCDEVTVARRLFRSGDSEYLVDGRRVRLRDLMDRLRELGIDGSRHIVVTQGMADALLSAAPVERRSLLEQAAGLSSYRVRRDEARQKLGTTEQNIATIGLVLEELEPRLRALRRQARAVQEREEAQKLLRQRLRAWYIHRWELAQADLNERWRKTESAAKHQQESESLLADLESGAEKALLLERSWQQRIDLLVAANHALERDRDAAERLQAQTEQHLLVLRQQRDSVEARLRRAILGQQDSELRVAQVTQSGRTAKSEMARLRAAEDLISLRLDQASDVLREAEAEHARVHREATEQGLAVRTIVAQGDKLEGRLTALVRRRDEIERLQQATQIELQNVVSELTIIAGRVVAAAGLIEKLANGLESAEQAAAGLRTQSTRLAVLYARALGADTDARRRMDSAQQSIQSLHLDGGESLVRSLVVDRGWETAIATALGRWAHAPVHDNSDIALHPNLNQSVEHWRASLDPLILPGKWADAVVTGMPEDRINPLRTVILVKTSQDAEDIWNSLSALPGHTIGTPPVCVVTKSGVCWSPVGRNTSLGDDRTASYLRLKREIGLMAARHAIFAKRVSRLESAHLESKARLKSAEQQTTNLQKDLRSSRSEASEHETRLARRERLKTELDGRIVSLQAEHAALDAEDLSLKAAFEEWKIRKQNSDCLVGEYARRVEIATASAAAVRVQVAALEQERRDAQHRNEVAMGEHRAHAQLLAASLAERDRISGERVAGETELAEVDAASRRYESELSAHENQVGRLSLLLQEHSASLAAARQARPDAGASQAELRSARAIMAERVRAHERAQLEYAAAQERTEVLTRDILEELRVHPTDLCGPAGEPPTETEIKRLRSRALQYADTESSVVDEARELAERHSFLLEHVADLRSAADNLRTMMEFADAEMHARFDVAFVAVSEEFSRVFEVMLRGGRARLEQLEGGGIEVVAQLPGKRSRSSAAFSGGERSLIASSLLFGVLKMRPTPFCVLDEVDAALDEGNVDRYLLALRDISRKTQAIVVTHNRATMAASDVLYGLTMDAEGTSSVLSLRLDAQAAG